MSGRKSSFVPSEDLKQRLKEAELKFGHTPAKQAARFAEIMQERKRERERREKKEQIRLDNASGHQEQVDDDGIDLVDLNAVHEEPPEPPQPSHTVVPSPLSAGNGGMDYTPPKWYTEIRSDSFAMKNMMKTKNKNDPSRQAVVALTALKECLCLCEQERNKIMLAIQHENLRNHVHKAEFLRVNKFVLKKVFILCNGLARVFAPKQGIDFPWDLKADALQLYLRWRDQNFEFDLLRGIKPAEGRGEHRNADRIDPKWPHRVSSKYYGQGELVLGQWWPTQLCMVRDGAHGVSQGGICGEKKMGAYSVVLSSGGYEDEDHGDWIWYTGTPGKDCTPTDVTTRLIESCDTIKKPVRVIRSSNLPNKHKQHRPERGFRYDGLYNVVAKQLVDQQTAMYKFKLVRCSGQYPIRSGDNAARRPTPQELDNYQKLRELGKLFE
ncbi:PUA-like domain-containing protein [Lophiotrema nucula]|uniref:PUA-like domain-containing protein n=1 Tax=Lophiotrema nucula TaxID=690887 RepID=A0A6A5YZB1_9PLEO|nr:PUA-like domain-containing protein [Lophiotrema nucula]